MKDKLGLSIAFGSVSIGIFWVVIWLCLLGLIKYWYYINSSELQHYFICNWRSVQEVENISFQNCYQDVSGGCQQDTGHEHEIQIMLLQSKAGTSQDC